MKFLANENIPGGTIRLLHANGFDVKAISSGNSGILDNEVMKMAIEEERTILTFDRDYGELIFRQAIKPKKGVILFRMSSFKPDEPAKWLMQALESKMVSLDSALTVIEKDQVRQRRYS